jgi:rubrerythrin
MDIFEYAMKMEMDGRMFYIEHANKATSPELKKILLELADDEQKHYNIFKALKDGHTAEYKEAEKTTILATVKNVFESLRAGDKNYAFPADAKKLWEEAREVEKKTEVFYREKAKEVGKPAQAAILNKIADEEHRHWVTMENVIQFLDRPTNWLESAEWTNLEDY